MLDKIEPLQDNFEIVNVNAVRHSVQISMFKIESVPSFLPSVGPIKTGWDPEPTNESFVGIHWSLIGRTFFINFE